MWSGSDDSRRQGGKDPARHESGYENPHECQYAQLRQAGDTRKQQAERAEDRGQYGQFQRRPYPRQGLLQSFSCDALCEDVGGVVDRFSNQCGAETQCDAMDEPEPGLYRRHSDEQAGQHRKEAQQERRHRPVDEKQQNRHHCDGDDGQSPRVALDRGAGFHREYAGAGHDQMGMLRQAG